MKPERNSPCPCGSGKKYKQCCAARETTPAGVTPVDPAQFSRAAQALQRGAFAEALAAGQRLLAGSPRNPDVLCLCGVSLRSLGQLDPAREHLEKAIVLVPARAEYRAALAEVFIGLKDYAKAAEHSRQAVALNPRLAEAHGQLAMALQGLDQVDECLALMQIALDLEPRSSARHINVGTAWELKGNYPEAERYYLKALQLSPEFAPGYALLGAMYLRWEKLADASVAILKSLSLDPSDAGALGNLYRLFYFANYSAELSREEIFRLHKRWGELKESKREATKPGPEVTATGTRRLRLGYISPDFRSIAPAYYIEPFIAHHNPELFEVTCYANVSRADEFTERFRRYPRNWRDIAGKTHDDVADMVRADGIDILVDLAGHTDSNRLPVFVSRPAPLQISYLGYPNTTGLTTVDYYVTDAWADPPGTSEHLYTEKLARLPGGFSCFRPEDTAPEVGPLPLRRTGQATFASLNVLQKVNDGVAALWAQVLEQVPGSRLVLQCHTLSDPAVQQSVLVRFARFNVDPARLELLPRMPLKDHLALYNRIDIALDPFPWNGHTTTSHALWMGVPVIALAGNTHAGRLATSVLCQLGLDELVARTHDEYVERAVSLAGDVSRLESLRTGMRHRMLKSMHGDGAAFTRSLEETLLDLWKNRRSM